MTFKEFMRAVDAEINKISGLSSHDIADFTYRDYFDAEVDPEMTAVDALENAGYDADVIYFH